MSKTVITLTLSEEDEEYLQSLVRNRTMQAQVADRIRILLAKADGKTYSGIADGLGISIPAVRRCVERYISGGTGPAFFGDERSGRPVEITDDAKAWIVSAARRKPCELGCAAELRTISALHKHIQEHAAEAGYPRLETAAKPWLQKYLKSMDIKPFKIRYYLERKDPDFDEKMYDVLLVYKQVEMQFDEEGKIIIPEDGNMTHTISYDEKPGIQAAADKYPDYNPASENGFVRRDYEYIRLGTLSLLANHSAHKSKEIKQYLANLPEGRFIFVFMPAHTSWLNMAEGFFGKMTKQMLKGIRVNTKEELSERIYRYFDEINADPIVYHWTYKMDEIDPSVGLKLHVLYVIIYYICERR